MNLTLCYAPIACSLVPLINLNEAGGSFEVRKINLRKGDNMTSDYLAMNPLHKVPVQIVDGRALTETSPSTPMSREPTRRPNCSRPIQWTNWKPFR
jgi:hypothetical protein